MKRILTIGTIAALASSVAAETFYTQNGTIGYVETPSAFMAPEGETSFTYYSNELQKGRRVEFQPSGWLSIGGEFSSNEVTGSDESFDLKLQLVKEGAYMPAIAVGMNDVFGIGPRSAEYIVASKNIGPIEASLGIGWGALAGSDPLFTNGERPAMDKHKLSTDHIFKGDAAPFGGLAWHSPIDGLSLSAEYLPKADGENFRYGIRYKRWGSVALGAYALGREQYGFSLTLSGNPNRAFAPQGLGQAPATVVPRHLLGMDISTDWANTPGLGKAMGNAMEKIVESEGYQLRASRVTARKIELEINDGETLLTPKIIGRITRNLAMNAPGSVEEFVITIVNGEHVPVSSVTINRREFEKQLEHPDRIRQSWESAKIAGATALRGDDVYRAEKQNRFNFSAGAEIEPKFGDDDDPISFTPFIKADMQLVRGLSLNAYASFNVGKRDATLDATDAPYRVRTDEPLYRQEIFTLERLTADYHFKLMRDLYGRLSMGLLETQYAGVDAELIYAPATLPIAIGIQAARVQKRDPEKIFGLLDFETTTGHGTIYWDTGYKGLEASISHGRFLGGDWGNTATLSRKFRNGWEVKSSISASEKFYDSRDTRHLDANIKVVIPFQWAAPFPTDSKVTIPFGGNSSDYVARLKIANPLYSSIRDYDAQDYKLRWGSFWQ